MDILLLGSGGREDALAWRLRQSPSCGELIAAPAIRASRAGPSASPIDPCDPRGGRRACPARGHRPGGGRPRSAAGRRGRRRAARRRASRCSARARPRRSSKAPRASPRICAGPTASRPPIMSASRRAADARAALDRFGIPVVIKADGLAAGKGVTVAMTPRRSRSGDRRRRRRAAGHRGIPRRRGSQPVRAGRRRDRRAARLGAGSQARRRRRHRPQHRRHGRLCARPRC